MKKKNAKQILKPQKFRLRRAIVYFNTNKSIDFSEIRRPRCDFLGEGGVCLSTLGGGESWQTYIIFIYFIIIIYKKVIYNIGTEILLLTSNLHNSTLRGRTETSLSGNESKFALYLSS